jgi:hypothetical protein
VDVFEEEPLWIPERAFVPHGGVRRSYGRVRETQLSLDDVGLANFRIEGSPPDQMMTFFTARKEIGELFLGLIGVASYAI